MKPHMGRAKNWTSDELAYLEDKWGSTSIKAIAKRLGRSVEGVKLKAQREGLTDARFLYDGITVNQLSFALKKSYSTLKNWIKRYDFPAKGKVFAQTERVLVVKYEDFWDWAEQHQAILNMAKLEPNLLGPEPEWVAEKRRADIMKANKSTRWQDWTPEDDKKLLSLVNAQKYTYPEICSMLNRSAGSIKRRLYDLGTKARPVRLNNHIKWKPEETRLLLELAEKGYGMNTIAEKVGKSEHAVRGKLERMKFDFKQLRVPHEVYREVYSG